MCVHVPIMLAKAKVAKILEYENLESPTKIYSRLGESCPITEEVWGKNIHKKLSKKDCTIIQGSPIV